MRPLLVLLSTGILSIASAGCQSGAQTEAAPVTLPSGAEVISDTEIGAIKRVKGENLSEALEGSARFREMREGGDYAGMSLSFLDHYRQEFRLRSPWDELSVSRISEDNLGYHQVRLQQSHLGLHVLDAELIVHFDSIDRIYLAQGQYLPTANAAVSDPLISEQEARRLIGEGLGSGFELSAGELAWLRAAATSARSVYRFEIKRGLTERREILVDAETGRTLRDTPITVNAR